MFLPIDMENYLSLKVVKLKNDVKAVAKMWKIAGFQCIFDGGLDVGLRCDLICDAISVTVPMC